MTLNLYQFTKLLKSRLGNGSEIKAHSTSSIGLFQVNKFELDFSVTELGATSEENAGHFGDLLAVPEPDLYMITNSRNSQCGPEECEETTQDYRRDPSAESGSQRSQSRDSSNSIAEGKYVIHAVQEEDDSKSGEEALPEASRHDDRVHLSQNTISITMSGQNNTSEKEGQDIKSGTEGQDIKSGTEGQKNEIFPNKPHQKTYSKQVKVTENVDCSCKNANVGTIVQYDKADPYSFIDFGQKTYSSSQIEYLMITRKKEKVKKTEEIWHYLYLIKSRDNKNSQTLTTLMKSNTDEYKKLLMLDDGLNQVIYFQRERDTQKIALMLFLIDKLQYKKLLAFPQDADDSFMHSRLSSSKATFALVLKQDQVAVVMEASTPNWYENLGKNICKVSLNHDRDSKLLELALWDTEGCPFSRFNSNSRKAIMATIDTAFCISVRVIEYGTSTSKWVNSESYQTSPPSPEDLGEWSKDRGIEDMRFLGLHVNLGVVMAVYIFEGEHQYLVVDQFIGSSGSFKKPPKSVSPNTPEPDIEERRLTEKGKYEPFPKLKEMTSETRAGTSPSQLTEVGQGNHLELGRRDIFKLPNNFDLADDTDETRKRCSLYCTFQDLSRGELKIFFTHCNFLFIADLEFRYDDSSTGLFLPTTTLRMKDMKLQLDTNRQNGKHLMKEYAPFLEHKANELHLFYLQKGVKPDDPPKIAIFQRSCNPSSFLEAVPQGVD